MHQKGKEKKITRVKVGFGIEKNEKEKERNQGVWQFCKI